MEEAHGAYDPLTGNIGISRSRIWHCGAAVVSKLYGPHAAFNKDGFSGNSDTTFWFDSTTLPIEPTTADSVWYQGNKLTISSVDPLLESGEDFYAYRVVASTATDMIYKNSGPPPLAPGDAPIIETWQWAFGGSAPQQPDMHGKPQLQALRWGIAAQPEQCWQGQPAAGDHRNTGHRHRRHRADHLQLPVGNRAAGTCWWGEGVAADRWRHRAHIHPQRAGPGR